MKKIFSIAAAALMVFACSKAPKAVVQGSVDNLKDTVVTLQRYIAGQVTTIDTVKVDGEGCFKHKIALTGAQPAFYYICDGENHLATVILLPGDKVSVNISAGDYTVEGSEESALLKEVTDNFAKAKNELFKLAEMNDRAGMGRTYIDYRKYATRHAFMNPHSITSAAIVFQKFSNDLPVFGEITDVVIFKQIYDSIQPVYPNSEYVAALKELTTSRSNILELSNRIDNTPVMNYPELKMPDVNGKEQVLSDLDGKVIILSFWSSSQNTHKMFNRTLMDVYGKYHSRGLEIYQICLDVDKVSWASTVKSQGLPWISVNDGLGNASPAVINYNITSVPAMYIIDRKGTLVGRDYYDPAELSRVIEKYL